MRSVVGCIRASVSTSPRCVFVDWGSMRVLPCPPLYQGTIVARHAHRRGVTMEKPRPDMEKQEE
eukprot:8354472-Pyramimonas_sp.AAC.1